MTTEQPWLCHSCEYPMTDKQWEALVNAPIPEGATFSNVVAPMTNEQGRKSFMEFRDRMQNTLRRPYFSFCCEKCGRGLETPLHGPFLPDWRWFSADKPLKDGGPDGPIRETWTQRDGMGEP